MGSLARLVVHLGAKTSDFETDMKRAAGISKTQMRKMERDAKRLNDTWNRNFRLRCRRCAVSKMIWKTLRPFTC